VDVNRPRDSSKIKLLSTAPQLYSNPDECIDCGACISVCPVSAIYALEDLPKNGTISWKSMPIGTLEKSRTAQMA
jgi:ferredoxin